MRASIYAATVAAALLGVPATATQDSCKPDSERMALSIIARGQGIFTGDGGASEALQAGFVQKAFTALAGYYPKSAATYEAYVRQSASSATLFLSNASYDAFSYPMDRLSNGNALLALSSAKGATNYRVTADALRQSINLNRRNSQGGLWYYTYPYWSYLDGMYSLGPFYTFYTVEETPTNSLGYSLALDDMLYQFEILWLHTRDPVTGLLRHGYDASLTAVWAAPETGSSPWVWGRSLGWYAMALVDTLEILEQHKAQRKYARPLLEKFQLLMAAVVKAVDSETGGWWQVVNQPGREGNYIESSGTAMFAYSLLKGARLGYLPYKFIPAARNVGIRAQKYLTRTFVVNEGNGTVGYNGTVAVCSLNSTASYDYYVHQPLLYNSVLGSAAYVLASLETERLH
ncbi:Six-hairpin glycosidase-like protein [Xylaria sp. FL0933]|nr:Six-hairpin glycosidase-like protein [Xylaria sp. FL0933]